MPRNRAKNRIEPPERVIATLGRAVYEGGTLAHAAGDTIFADYGIPGEEVAIDLHTKRAGVKLGRVVDVIDPSEHRIEPPCEYFGRCGGCQLQHITYEHQLVLKREIVAETLTKIGAFDDPPVSPTVGAENPGGYRNPGRFTAKSRGEIGFIERGSHRFLRIDHCLIADDVINDSLTKLQGRCGGLHQVAFRLGVNTGEMLVHPDLADIEPSIPSGQRYYHEELLGHRFRISAASFFQTNTRQAGRLIELLRDRLSLDPGDVLVDAYAGVGTFAVILAPDVAQVVAVEESAAAVDDAMLNITDSPNVQYYRGKVEDVLSDATDRADALILDPPRQGCHPRTLETVIALQPPKLAYVSCDPSTLARDLRVLVDSGYTLEDVTPIDMFPHTQHIECVASLRR